MVENIERYIKAVNKGIPRKEEKYPLDILVMNIVSGLSKSFDSYQVQDMLGFEEKLADTFIRIFELCSYLEYVPTGIGYKYSRGSVDKMPGFLHAIINGILDLSRDDFEIPVVICINHILRICHSLNIDIEAKVNSKIGQPYPHNLTAVS